MHESRDSRTAAIRAHNLEPLKLNSTELQQKLACEGNFLVPGSP